MLLTRINFAADLISNRLPGSRVTKESIGNVEQLAQLIAPQSLSASTRTALDETSGADAVALLLAAPEFQRR
jgi:hypothetical protein